MKSESSRLNGCFLCISCHVWKTLNGKAARPLLLAYLERVEGKAA